MCASSRYVPGMRRAVLAPALMLMLLPLPAQSAAPGKPAAEPQGMSLCPAELAVEQRAAAVPAGWEAGTSGLKSQLSAVTFFDGPPSERASLKYDTEERPKRDWVATWNLKPNARGYWIQCSYDHTTVVLAKRLPETTAECRVFYERKAQVTGYGLPTVRHVGCK